MAHFMLIAKAHILSNNTYNEAKGNVKPLFLFF